MVVDVQGALGKKVEFLSILWSSVMSYSVQTAGAFMDRDMELNLYTNILGLGRIEQDLRHGKADLFQLQKVLCNHILGEDTDPMPGSVRTSHEGQVDEKGFWWFRDNQRPLDAVEMNRVYHSTPPILRGNETIEMAFKGHRDVTLLYVIGSSLIDDTASAPRESLAAPLSHPFFFSSTPKKLTSTNLRVIMIDPKGLVGKKVEYTSLPWTSITAHAVRTASKWLDYDTEVCFWTEMDFYPGKAGGGEDSPPLPPRPEQSYL